MAERLVRLCVCPVDPDIPPRSESASVGHSQYGYAKVRMCLHAEGYDADDDETDGNGTYRLKRVRVRMFALQTR